MCRAASVADGPSRWAQTSSTYTSVSGHISPGSGGRTASCCAAGCLGGTAGSMPTVWPSTPGFGDSYFCHFARCARYFLWRLVVLNDCRVEQLGSVPSCLLRPSRSRRIRESFRRAVVLFDSEVSTESWRLFAVRFAPQWVEQVERCIGGVLATSAGALHVALRSSGVGMSNVCGDVIERNARVA